GRRPSSGECRASEVQAWGVDLVLLVPPLWDPSGNAYSLSLARSQPDRYAVMGVVDMNAADLVTPIRAWRQQEGMLGARFLFNTPERLRPLLEGRLDAVWPVAEEAGLVVALLMPGQLARIDDIATRHPRLKIIVDHMGVPRGSSGPMAFDHLPQLLALARHPNLYV